MTTYWTPIGSAVPTPQVTYGTTPPASPNDGDRWIFPADATNGVTWAFRYNAGSASSYRWEFVGGPPMYAMLLATEAIAAANAWTDCATVGPRITVPRAGDYIPSYSAVCSPPTSGIIQLGVAVGATTPGLGIRSDAAVANGVTSMTGTDPPMTLASGADLRVRYYAAATSFNFLWRRLFLLPVRVS
jgi:hypothetical protein